MPLIIITGYPCSGKTVRASQLAIAFRERIASSITAERWSASRLSVVNLLSYHDAASHLSGDETCPTRDSIYSSATAEKTARAAELSAVKQALSSDTIVIADGLNYIKGFRYQLWCEAKTVGTRCCTVHCAAREDQVAAWNRSRLRLWAGSHGEDVLEEDGDASAVLDPGGGVRRTEENSLPESHTAIYGDRVLDLCTRSRSSSLDANDGDAAVPRPTTLFEESLTSVCLSGPASIPGGDDPFASAPTESSSVPLPAAESSSGDNDFFVLSPTSRPYSSKTLRSLLMRYEPPSPFSKWDSPLFTVPACDPLPPTSVIWDALFPSSETRAAARTYRTGNAITDVKPHTATVIPPATATNALQLLERTTSDVVTEILNQMQNRADIPSVQDGGAEIEIRLAGGDGGGKDPVGTLSVPMGTKLALPMLQRLRRRFTQIQRGGIAHGQGYVRGEQAVGEAFVRFLNGELGG